MNGPRARYSTDFLRALPKTDLHCHLDGSLRLGTLIELARERKVKLPSETEQGLRELVFKEQYRDLPDYLHGFAYTCAVLTDEEALERVSYELGQDCLAEGVRYLEVRFAPQLHVRSGVLDIPRILAAVDRGLARVRREHEATDGVSNHGEPPFRYGLICCAMRMFTAGFGPYFRDLLDVLPHWPVKKVYGIASLSLARAVVDARDRHGLPVVGFDLAGAEAGHPAHDHVEAYDFCHRHFLKKTVHAGEAYGPESIFEAITRLNADRIGHGTHLYAVDQVEDDDAHRYVRQLSEYIADRRVLIEVCVTSNMQTMPELRRVQDHPLGRMIQDRLSVTLCTDNRLVSRTTVTEEVHKVTEAFHMTSAELRNTLLHGFKRSFFPGSYKEKRAYVRKVIDFYDRVSKEHGQPTVARGEER
ncbi:MAG: adenosine deaminase family protein [Alphaproteobacteria bacterium]|nr:adenosine deaminase family protein [Alphaproteobacteria bacterium]MCB9697050.1 adenosine deaminase family protein [Alphaproteobacteria bacterium]